MSRPADKRIPEQRLLLPAPSRRYELRDTGCEAAFSTRQSPGRIANVEERSSRRRLWLAVYLPHLVLEVFGPTGAPLAVSDGPANRPVIRARNRAAAAHGVLPGMGLAAARTLCHDLRVTPRDEGQERNALEGIALWAHQFTPVVHLQSDGLLLEIAGSLRLFGGVEALLTQVAEGLSELGYRARFAVAPTPVGSRLLARNGREAVLTRKADLQTALRRLPIQGLEVAPELKAALRGMGLRLLGDCLRLPRDGLARRLGPDFLLYVDRAFGRMPDPRPAFDPPPRFASRLPLPAEVDNSEALLFGMRRLMLELVGFLRAQGAGIQSATIVLEHRGRPPSRLDLGLVRPSRDPDHLMTLLRERVERFELPAPVDAMGLEAGRLLPLERDHGDLFTAGRAERTGDWHLLAEKLRARLGPDAVAGLRPHPDHRPENAWRKAPPGESPPAVSRDHRPLWLLPAPVRLQTRPEGPWLDGPLRLVSGPERVESGWWDGQDAARDYFVAEDTAGERLWLFRERRNAAWFLQGLFS